MKTFSLDDGGIIFSVNDAASMAASWFMEALLDDDEEFMTLFNEGLMLDYDGIPTSTLESLVKSISRYGEAIHKFNIEFEERNLLEYPTTTQCNFDDLIALNRDDELERRLILAERFIDNLTV
ncbi:hypothetical protein S14_236 [Shewanella sp. phage 1/4]|uniref:hypothetical protein n=1 Tax=Shewanella phage 1/4 TaxID=1458859 RepID=UPI0004F863D2|nr:hypothetical protein S14_236 [Shewanella sp. phage 1/4]AHK11345.1 hypothetical protein S14_236 [Shewanella sp. phage 1/4]